MHKVLTQKSFVSLVGADGFIVTSYVVLGESVKYFHDPLTICPASK